MRAIFLADGNIFTTGFSRMSERQLALWNPVSQTHRLSPCVKKKIKRCCHEIFCVIFRKTWMSRYLCMKWTPAMECCCPSMTLTLMLSTCVERSACFFVFLTHAKFILPAYEFRAAKLENNKTCFCSRVTAASVTLRSRTRHHLCTTSIRFPARSLREAWVICLKEV